MADVWIANLNVLLPSADAAWLADRLRALPHGIEGSHEAAIALEAAIEDRVSSDVSLDVAERHAVRLALTESDESIDGAPALVQLLEMLGRPPLSGG